MRSALAAIITFALIAIAGSIAAQEAPPAKVRVQLVADVTAAGPGEEVRIGLLQTIEPGWHTYWKNPGDSGEATRIAYEVPAGVEVAGAAWPHPERIPYYDLMNYGYEDEVLLPSTLTIPESWPAGEPIAIRASAEWLVCADICIPESADVEMVLATRPGGGSPSAHSDLFEATSLKQPIPSPWGTSVTAGDALEIRIDGDFARSPITDAYVFAAEWGAIEPAAPQPFEIDAAGLRLLATPGDLVSEGTFEGVLTLSEDVGGDILTRAYAITAEITPGTVAAISEAGLSVPTSAMAPILGIGILQAMLFALLGGVILNLMPCVFPILSMKALGLVRGAHEERRETIAHGLAYTLGILLTFSAMAALVIGLRAAGTQVGWGMQLQSPLVVTLLAYLLLAIGLNLSGVFTVGSRVMGLGSGATQLGGRLGSLATGALAVVVATPCVAPFMGAALGFAFTQPAPATLAVFLCLGLGLAFPYLALTLVPGLARVLPKPGPWMERLKQALAFPMYASTAWLVWVVSQQVGEAALFAILMGAVLIGLAAWLKSLGDAASGVTARRLTGAFATASILGALTLLPFGSASPPVGGEGEAQAAAISADPLAEPFSRARLDQLRAEGTPVLINLTAAWCITCKVNDRVALSGERFAQALSDHGVTYLKGDWTNQDPEVTALLDAHGRSGVPLYLVYPRGSGDAEVLPQLLTEGLVLDALARAT